MRILQVTDWNPSRGGAEEYVGWLVSALPSLGHEVALLTSSAGTAGDGRADYVALGTRWAAAQVGLQIFNPHAWIQARRARAEFRPDLAHVHLFAYHLSPAVIFSLRGVPVVVTHHDYKAGCPLGTRLLPDHRPCVDAPGPICRSGGCLGFLHWQRDRVRYRLLQRALRQAAAGVVHSRTMAGSCRALGMETVSMPLQTGRLTPPPEANSASTAIEPEAGLDCTSISGSKVTVWVTPQSPQPKPPTSVSKPRQTVTESLAMNSRLSNEICAGAE
ncbi:MAG: glycosyltransferase family 4 protein [Verrucomicrobiota bacterium]